MLQLINFTVIVVTILEQRDKMNVVISKIIINRKWVSSINSSLIDII